MRAALLYLLKDTERYVITVKRPRFNWETGRDQSPGLTLYENDTLDLATVLDPRLSRSRRVLVLVTDKEKGTCQINLTAREWEVWNDSPQLRDKLTSFNQQLIAGARSRIITAGVAGWILFTPVWSSFLIGIIWSFSSRRVRRLFSQPTSPASQAAINKARPRSIRQRHNGSITMSIQWLSFGLFS